MLNKIIPNFLRARIALAILVIILAAFAETFGLSLIMPLLSTVTGQGDQGKIADLFASIVGELSLNRILFLICAMYTLKFGLLVVRNYLIYSIEWGLRGYWVTSIYEYNLARPYAEFEKEKPGYVTNEITNETLKAASAVNNILSLIGQILLVTCLTVLLLISNFVYTACIVGVGALGLLAVKYLIIPKVQRYGALRQQYEAQVYHEVNEMVHGMKPMRFLGLERFFLTRFGRSVNSLIKLMNKAEVVRRLPAQLTEVIVVILLVSGIYIGTEILGVDMPSIMPFLGMMVLISIRLSQNAGTMANGHTAIKQLWPSVELIAQSIDKFNSSKLTSEHCEENGDYCFEKNLCFENVFFSYQKDVPVIKDLNVGFKKNEISVIMGESGSGKSTLIKLIMKMYAPNAGSITVDGAPIDKIANRQWRSKIGYVDQEHYFFNGTIRENLTQGRTGVSDQEINDILELTHSKQFVQNLPRGLDSSIGDKGNALSGGQKSRLDLARALILKPEILILDEVTGQLNLEIKKHIVNSLKKLKKDKTIIIISHDNELVNMADCVYEFKDKHIVEFNRSCKGSYRQI